MLSQSRSHPELISNVGNIALLQRAEDAGLLPKTVGYEAAKAYRELRRLQHVARLDERSGQLEPELAKPQREAVLKLWNTVFRGEAAALPT